MTAHAELAASIYAKLSSTGDFNTAVDGRIYYARAEDSPTFPYCVYSFYADNYSIDSGNEWEETYIQFSLYDENAESDNIDLMESYLIDLLKTTLTFTNYTQIRLQRGSKRFHQTEDDKWNTIIEYRIEIEHN